jgi:hypothetical protein
MKKPVNNFKFPTDEAYEQEHKESEASDTEEGVLGPASGAEGSSELSSSASAEEQRENGGDAGREGDGNGGGHHAQQPTPQKPVYIKPFPGCPLETLEARIVHVKDVRDAVQAYVDVLMPYAAKGKYPPPPTDPDSAHQFTIIDDRLVMWLVPDKVYTEVQFTFCTEDDIRVRIQEPMELASGLRVAWMKKEVGDFIATRRRERQQGARSLIIH